MLRERAGIPESLDALVAKLLQKDPAKRYQSAAELLDALSALKGKSAEAARFILRAVDRELDNA
jgi:serine/threonine protein kinase